MPARTKIRNAWDAAKPGIFGITLCLVPATGLLMKTILKHGTNIPQGNPNLLLVAGGILTAAACVKTMRDTLSSTHLVVHEGVGIRTPTFSAAVVSSYNVTAEEYTRGLMLRYATDVTFATVALSLTQQFVQTTIVSGHTTVGLIAGAVSTACFAAEAGRYLLSMRRTLMQFPPPSPAPHG